MKTMHPFKSINILDEELVEMIQQELIVVKLQSVVVIIGYTPV